MPLIPKPKTMFRSLYEKVVPPNSDTTLTKERPDGFLTAKGIDALFPRTNPETDGEECLHDCASCSVSLPRKWSIDEEDRLYGGINGWSRHLLVATGQTDWVRSVEDVKGSVMEAVGQHMSKVEGGKLMLSASNIPPPEIPGDHIGPYGPDRPTTVLLMPSFTYIENVTPKHVPQLIESVINTAPTNTTRLDSTDLQSNGTTSNGDVPHTPMPPPPKNLPAGLTLRSCPHKYIILLCSQATRDARCGQSAPLLRKELERHLRPLGLFRDLHDERPGGVGIYFISHTGGHKYSANMMVYRRAEIRRTVQEQMENGEANGEKSNFEDGEAAQCIWLARIRPEDCENVVRFTVLQGKVVKPERQLRGGFDREKGIHLLGPAPSSLSIYFPFQRPPVIIIKCREYTHIPWSRRDEVIESFTHADDSGYGAVHESNEAAWGLGIVMKRGTPVVELVEDDRSGVSGTWEEFSK